MPATAAVATPEDLQRLYGTAPAPPTAPVAPASPPPASPADLERLYAPPVGAPSAPQRAAAAPLPRQPGAPPILPPVPGGFTAPPRPPGLGPSTLGPPPPVMKGTSLRQISAEPTAKPTASKRTTPGAAPAEAPFPWEARHPSAGELTAPPTQESPLSRGVPSPEDVNRMVAATLLSDVSAVMPLKRGPPLVAPPRYHVGAAAEATLRQADHAIDSLPAWMHGPHPRLAEAGPASRQLESLRAAQAQAVVGVGKALPAQMSEWQAEEQRLKQGWAAMAEFARQNQGALDPESVRGYQNAVARLKSATATHTARGEQLDALQHRVKQTWEQFSSRPLFSRNYPEEEAFRQHSVGGDAWGWVVDRVSGMAAPIASSLKGVEDRLINQKMLAGEYPPNPVIPAKNLTERQRYIGQWNDVQRFVEDRKLYDYGQVNFPRSELEARYRQLTPWQRQAVDVAQKQLDARMDARLKSGRGVGALADAALWVGAELGGRALAGRAAGLVERSAAPWLLRMAEGSITPGLIRAVAVRSPELAAAMAHGGTLMGLQGGVSTLAATHDPLQALKAGGAAGLEGMLFGGLTAGAGALAAPVAGAIQQPLVRGAVRGALSVGGVAGASGTLAAGKALVAGKGSRGALTAAGTGAAEGALQGALFTLLHTLQAAPGSLDRPPPVAADRAGALGDWAFARSKASGWTDPQSRAAARVVERMARATPDDRLSVWQKQPAAVQRLLTSLGSLYGPAEPTVSPRPAAGARAMPATPAAAAEAAPPPRITTEVGTSVSLRHLPIAAVKAHGGAAAAAGDAQGAAAANALVAADAQHQLHVSGNVPPGLVHEWAAAKVKPGNPAMSASRLLRAQAGTFEKGDPDLAQKLHEASDLAAAGFRRNWLEDHGSPPVAPKAGPVLVSPWRKLSPEQQAKVPMNVRTALLVQDASHSLENLDPAHSPIFSALDLPGKPRTAKALEELADRLHDQASGVVAQRLAPAPPAVAPPPVTAEAPPVLVQAPPAPVETTPAPAPGAPPPATAAPAGPTIDLTGMGGAIGANLRDRLWAGVERGEKTEAGVPSLLMRAAQTVRERGGLQDRASFDRFAEAVQQARDTLKGNELATAMEGIVRAYSPGGGAGAGQAPPLAPPAPPQHRQPTAEGPVEAGHLQPGAVVRRGESGTVLSLETAATAGPHAGQWRARVFEPGSGNLRTGEKVWVRPEDLKGGYSLVSAAEAPAAPAKPLKPAAAPTAAAPPPKAEPAPHEMTKAAFVARYGQPEDLWPNQALAPVAATGEPGIRLEQTTPRTPSDPKQAFVFRDAKGQAVGTLAFHEQSGPQGEKRASRIEIYVDPEARGKGVASQLQSALEKGGYELPALGSAGRQMTFSGAGLYHGRAVAQAVAEGKAVPEKVLRDYPKLAPKAAALTERRGSETEVRAGEQKIAARWEVHAIADLVTSHTENLAQTPGYPQALQPRDRSRIASREQIADLANRLDPELMAENPLAQHGAPIIGSDRAVESGNARTIALRQAYRTGGAAASRYRDWLRQNAARFGISPAALAGIGQPILVRRRTSPLSPEERIRFTQAANARETAAMGGAETAKVDASRLTPTVLRDYDPATELTAATNRGFMRDFIGTLPPAEHAGMRTADGGLSQEALIRARNALFHYAYGDTGALVRLAEATDDPTRNVTSGLLRAAGFVGELREKAAAGQAHPLDISGDVAAAAGQLASLKDQGVSVAQYLAQQTLLGEGLDPFQQQILKALEAAKRSPKQIAALVGDYVDVALKAGDPRTASLFEGIGPPTKEEVWRAALARQQEIATHEPSLFAAAAEAAPPTAGREGAGAPAARKPVEGGLAAIARPMEKPPPPMGPAAKRPTKPAARPGPRAAAGREPTTRALTRDQVQEGLVVGIAGTKATVRVVRVSPEGRVEFAVVKADKAAGFPAGGFHLAEMGPFLEDAVPGPAGTVRAKGQQQQPRMSDAELAARRALQDRQYKEALDKQLAAQRAKQAKALEDEARHWAAVDVPGSDAQARALRHQARILRRGGEPVTAKEHFLAELERTSANDWTPTEARNLARLQGATTGHPVDFTGFRQEAVGGRIPDTGVFHGLTAMVAKGYSRDRWWVGTAREPLALLVGPMRSFSVEPLAFDNPLVIRGGHYALTDDALAGLPFDEREKHAIASASEAVVRLGERGYALLDRLTAAAARRAGFDSIIYRKPRVPELTEVVDLRSVMPPPLPEAGSTLAQRLARREEQHRARLLAEQDAAARRMGFSSDAERRAALGLAAAPEGTGPSLLKQQQQQAPMEEGELARRQAEQREQEAAARAKPPSVNVEAPEKGELEPRVYDDPSLESFRVDNRGEKRVPELNRPFKEELRAKALRVGALLREVIPSLPDNPHNAPLVRKLLRLQKLPSIGSLEAHFRLNDVLHSLTPDALQLMEGAMLVPDLLEDVKKGVALPEGITEEKLTAEAPKIAAKLAASPKVAQAVTDWRKMTNETATAWRQSVIDIGQKPPALDREDWFHHEVRQELQDAARQPGAPTRLKATLRPTFTWEREGGVPFNTHLIEAHQRVIARMIRLTEENKVIRFVQDPKNGFNIKPHLDAVNALGKDAEATAWFQGAAASGGGEIVVRAIPARVGAMATTSELPNDPNGRFDGVVREIANNTQANEARPAGSEPVPFDPGLTGELADYARFVLEQFRAEPGKPQGKAGAVPATHRTYRYVEGQTYYRTTGLAPAAAKLAEAVAQGVTDSLTVGREDLRQVIGVGRRRGDMVLEAGAAQALEKLRDNPPNEYDRGIRWVTNKVKGFVILNPEHLPTFMREKTIGDTVRIFRGAPGVFLKLPQAAQDLWAVRTRKEGPSAELRRWYFQEGGRGFVGSFEGMGGAPEVDLLQHLAVNDERTPGEKTWRLLRGLARIGPDRLDELVRYAAFLHFGEEIDRDGEPQAIGAARRDLAMALTTRDEQARFLSNHLMGAYDEIPAAIRALRDRVPFPYWGFMTAQMRSETNLFLNAVWREPQVFSTAAKALGIEPKSMGGVRAVNATLFLMKLMAVVGGAAAYNWLTHKKDEEMMDDPSPHVDLGHTPGGGLIVWPRIGALPNVAQIGGLDDPMGWWQMAANGHLTAKELAKRFARSGPQEWLALAGIAKAPVELAGRRRLGTGSPINDRMEYLAQQFHVPFMYEAARRGVGKLFPGVLPHPQKGGMAGQALAVLAGGILMEPAEMAYRDAVGRAREWVADEKGIPPQQKAQFAITPVSAALYQYKRALEFGENDTALKYLAGYVQAGGTEKNLRQNLARLEPLSGLNRTSAARYLKTLGGEDRAQIRNAYRFWQGFAAPAVNEGLLAQIEREADLQRYTERMSRAVDAALSREHAVADFLKTRPELARELRQEARKAKVERTRWRYRAPAFR